MLICKGPVLVLLVLGLIVQCSADTWGNIDIDTLHNDFLEDDGSGKHPVKKEDTTDDEDLLYNSGETSGEGSGTHDGTTSAEKHFTQPPTTTTTKKLTACQQLRLSTKDFSSDYYIPECTDSGEYQKRQCEGKPGSRKCWCVDHKGREIPGTQMPEPTLPDCYKGTNLKPCVFELLQNSRGLLGAYKPRCSLFGEYEEIQCHNRECWCVDPNGIEKIGSRMVMSGTPIKCTEPPMIKPDPPIIIEPETPRPEPETTKRPGYDFDLDDKDKDEQPDEVKPPTDVDINIDGGKFNEPSEKDDNSINKSERMENQPRSTFLQIMESPGILAAVIGGSVVGLLCAILLVMFIIYRMKKKDEGSYPLDEQKYTNYSYMKAPDKEYYA